MESVVDGDSYKYETISEGSFRVLQVESWDLQIQISLQVESIEKPPKYHAISYSWEGLIPSIPIRCNGRKIMVTTTIAEALRCIPKTTGDTLLWVDSICISQIDGLEKANQVTKMHQIFGNAEGVIIWLGPATDETDGVMDAIPGISAKVTPMKEYVWRIQEDFELPSSTRFLPIVKPLRQLIERSWFRRLWVVQEIILAKSFRWMCGEKVVEQEALPRVVEFLQLHLTDSPAIQSLRMIVEKRWDLSNGGWLYFETLVNQMREREAKEPVDRIYALLSLARGHDKCYVDGIVVDYSQRAREEYWRLYTQFGKLALRSQSMLEFFNYASSRFRPQGFPSWCPNFNSTRLTQPMRRLYRAGALSAIGDPRPSLCDAPGVFSNCRVAHPEYRDKIARRPIPKVSPDHDEIIIKGTAADEVLLVSASCDWNVMSISDANLNWMTTSFQLYYYAQRGYSDSPDQLVVAQNRFVKVLFEGDIPWNFESYAKDRPLGATFFDLIEEQLRKKENVREMRQLEGQLGHLEGQSTAAERELEQNGLRDNGRELMFKDWLTELQRIWAHRSLIITKSGRIGFADETVQSGDKVCMFYGCLTLFILRPINSIEKEAYSFISESYLDGLMDGEVFNMMHRGETKEREFVII